MSIRTGSRPKWLYGTENGWHYIVRLRLRIAFRSGAKSRRSDNLAGAWSQWSTADGLALPGFAVLALDRHAVYAQYAVFAKHAVFAPAESAAFALGSTTLGRIILGSPSVDQ
jgi:hypothetical protein